MVLTAAAALTACTQSSAAVDLPSAAEFETQVLDQVNALRFAENVSSLELSDCLVGHARSRAASLPGATEVPQEDLPADCGDYDYAGENIARSDQSPSQVVDMWAGEATQQPNLVDPAFVVAGVGCVPVAAADNSRVAEGDEDVAGMACSMIFQGYSP
ncbi:CAP domain-containing protein [Demequina sp. NBRC 110057]|uniref:CAP domain-containing protein n=1 Tax=Demequina sp. NBRC 110057 TaxID=1570346 RepID=UPI000A03120A|nr:CAP domain-containing protein [Demequina sp. NBRC 110057]